MSANQRRAAVWVLILCFVVYRVPRMPPAAVDRIRIVSDLLVAALGLRRSLDFVQYLLGDCGEERGARGPFGIPDIARVCMCSW